MKRLLKRLVRGYQKGISPNLPPSCIYHPTCSNYALEALEKHGALKGSLMSAARILRCHPFAEGGVDKVPDHFSLRRNKESEMMDEDYQLFLEKHLGGLTSEQKKEIAIWMGRYGADIQVWEKLPEITQVLKTIGEAEEIDWQSFLEYFDEEDQKILIDRQIGEEDLKFFHIPDLIADCALFEWGEKRIYPDAVFVILSEKFQMLYASNHSGFAAHLLKSMGVTRADIDQQSFHLYSTLALIDEYENN